MVVETHPGAPATMVSANRPTNQASRGVEGVPVLPASGPGSSCARWPVPRSSLITDCNRSVMM